MSSGKLVLFVGKDFVSVFAMSAYVALAEKGLEFAIQVVDLKAKEQFKSAYRDISLTCRVPTLVHGGFCLSESSAIAEYLEDLYPSPKYVAVLPSDVDLRARARQVQAWLRSDMLPLRSERPADLFYAPSDVAPLSPAAQAAADKLIAVSETLIGHSSQNLFGEWCIADTDLGVMLNRLVANGDPVPVKIARYVERQWQRDSVVQWRKQAR